ncbi:hypothetical protein [Carboxylicivirga caseinilyticus]|uniref:hypothetical protein n=1 Tax=Carboxylicivirga caseinilyticus TaxID=3417572 RepID=UPI003D348AE9|nr:hypothetical protein [Marinilabiliaceae bacterium A049]
MNIMKAIKIFGVLFILGVLSSCEYNFITPDTGAPVDPDETVSFSEQIEPIWSTQGCTSCHPSTAGLDLRVGYAYQSLQSESRINTENPTESLILTMPGSSGVHSDKDYVSNQRELIKVWIQQGAQDN